MLNTEIEKLTTTEKIQVMETLWDSLCREENSLDSPQWHLDLLEQRAITLNQGTEAFEDWSQAKQDIRQQLL